MMGLSGALAVLALAACLGTLLYLVLPPQRGVRVRNAFLLRRGRPEDFAWTPPSVPSDFRVETAEAPASIAIAVAESGIPGIADDWARARALTSMLVRHSRHEGGIRSDLATTYRRIVEGHGYCVDYVRVYMAAARGANLFCRQWAFSFDGFGGHGHTFVEIYDRQRAAWRFLDVHNNVYAVTGGREAPVDALSLHAALRAAPETVEFVRAGEGRLGWPVPGKLLAYYLRGVDQWYLWWGNDVVTRERSGLAGGLGRVSGRIGHGLTSVFGALPPIVALASPENEPAIARMQRLRRQVVALAVVAGALVAALLVQLAWPWIAARSV